MVRAALGAHFGPSTGVAWEASRSPQRHRSWMGTTSSGASYWLKVGVAETTVAGVVRESRVLAELGGRCGTPHLVTCGEGPPAFLVTQHVSGKLLAESPAAQVSAFLPALVDALVRFHMSAGVPPYPPCSVDDRDLFGPRPAPIRLLGQDGVAFWRAAVSTAATDQLFRTDPLAAKLTVGSVHGSFDLRNVLIGPNGRSVGLVDLEASRPGPIEVDVAGMACDLLLTRGSVAALAWIDLWRQQGRSVDRRTIGQFMALRLWYRHLAVGLESGPLRKAARLLGAMIER